MYRSIFKFSINWSNDSPTAYNGLLGQTIFALCRHCWYAREDGSWDFGAREASKLPHTSRGRSSYYRNVQSTARMHQGIKIINWFCPKVSSIINIVKICFTQERIVPPDPITPSEKRTTLQRLNQVIQHRLVTGNLLPQMRNLKVMIDISIVSRSQTI